MMLPRICDTLKAMTRGHVLPSSRYIRSLSTIEGGVGQPPEEGAFQGTSDHPTQDLTEQFLFTTSDPRKNDATDSLPPIPQWEIPHDLAPTEQMIEAYTRKGRSKRFNKVVDIPPDTDPLLGYLTSRLMNDGKRHTAAKRVSRLLLYIYGWLRSPPLPILRQAVLLASPEVRIVSNITPAGKKTERPYPLSERQRTFYAIKWILNASERQKKSGKSVEERLARTILEIVQARYPIGGEHKKDPILENMPEPVQMKRLVHLTATINRANIPRAS